LDGYRLLEKYIKEELNVLQLELVQNEDEFVMYKAAPENRAMGQAFGKKFNKGVKTAIDKLSSDDIRKFLKDGKIEVTGLEITSDMLKISKTFKKEYTNHKQFATHSSNSVSVMLDKVLTEDLLSIGYSREVTNRI